MRTKLPVLVAVMLLGVPTITSAQGPAGNEFQVNTYTTNYQSAPALALDAAGNFVVVWNSGQQDGSISGVFGQRFSSGGTGVGTEFQVNTYTLGDQQNAAVGGDAAGNFVVVWTSGRSSNNQDGNLAGVFGQRFSNTGSRLGTEFQVNTYTPNQQYGSAIALDVTGNFVVVWMTNGGHDGDGRGVFGQRFSSNGTRVGTEFQVNTYTTGDQAAYPLAVALSPTGFVVVWHDGNGEDGSGYGIFGQRFDAGGARLGTEFQVNTFTNDDQKNPAVAADGAGNFVVVWESKGGQDGDDYGVFGQRFSNTGARLGTEFQVNTYTTGYQGTYPGSGVAADAAGNFMVVWVSKGGQDGSSYGAFGQRFSSSGQRVGTEFQVNTYTQHDQKYPAVASNAAGAFVVAWQSYEQVDPADEATDIFAQRFEAPPAAARRPAPALSRVGLIVLGLALVFAGGALVIRRQRRA